MTRAEAMRVFALLQGAYPRQELPASTESIYAAALGDLDVVAVERAVLFLIRTSRWLPTIAEIREHVAEEQVALPEPEFAWAEVRDAIGRYGLDQARPPWSCPEIGAAVSVLGWRTLCTTENSGRERERWIKTYAALRRRRIEQVAAPAGTLPGQLRLMPGGGKPT